MSSTAGCALVVGRILSPWTLALGVLSLAPGRAAAQLELRHGAPLLGSTLAVEVDGAPPGAPIVLFASQRSAHRQTASGLLELGRESMTVVAHGFADAGGSFATGLALPVERSAAEAPLHLQALVRGFGGVPQLTPAAHLRILGSRAYVSCQGWHSPPLATTPGELTIVSLVHHERIASVDYGRLVSPGFVPDSGEPVFSANFARGAIVPDESELIVFDPYFGRAIARLPLANASGILFADRDGATAYVLEGVNGPAPRILAVDLATATVASVLPLGGAPLSSLWTVDSVRGIAYVASAPSSSASMHVRRADLDGSVDLGSWPIGDPLARRVSAIARDGERVFVASDAVVGLPPVSIAGTLTRIVEGPSGPGIDVAVSGGNLSRIAPLPSFGLVALWSHHLNMPSGWLWLEREAASTGSLSIGVLQFGGVLDMIESPLGLWAVSANDGILSGGYTLAEYDLSARGWIEPGESIPFTPAGLDVVRDGLGVRPCVADKGVLGSVIYERPRVHVFGPGPGEVHSVPIGGPPLALRVVSVP